MSRRGRPLAPLEPSASAAARLGAELRELRLQHELTLAGLAARVGYSLQYISQIEHGRTVASEVFVHSCETELRADGALTGLLPAAILEHARHRARRTAARRGAHVHDDNENTLDPITRRDTGTATARLLAAAAPTAAREVDPALPDHWEQLLAIVGTHDAAHGPHGVLDAVRRELRLIAEYREIARGELRTKLMSVEARWVVYAAWVCEDTGDRRGRTALLERALCLAREADHPALIAWTRARQAQWTDAPRAIRLAQAGLRTPRADPHTRALCAVRAAHAHAHIGDVQATKRMLAQAYTLAAQDSAPPPLSASTPLAEHVVRCWEARCWAVLSPARGVRLLDDLLRDWPRGRTRDGGLYLARLANACAAAGQPDRARAEGAKALAVARTTRSHVGARELTQLTAALRT
jgi:transcriptional regulator with XRE-family HTH domain